MASLETVISGPSPTGGDTGSEVARKINSNFSKLNVTNGLVDVCNANMTSFVKNSYNGAIVASDTLNTSINRLQNRLIAVETGTTDICASSMSGYTYSAASGGISTSDTLNTSVNKLQNRITSLESTPKATSLYPNYVISEYYENEEISQGASRTIDIPLGVPSSKKILKVELNNKVRKENMITLINNDSNNSTMVYVQTPFKGQSGAAEGIYTQSMGDGYNNSRILEANSSLNTGGAFFIGNINTNTFVEIGNFRFLTNPDGTWHLNVTVLNDGSTFVFTSVRCAGYVWTN